MDLERGSRNATEPSQAIIRYYYFYILTRFSLTLVSCTYFRLSFITLYHMIGLSLSLGAFIPILSCVRVPPLTYLHTIRSVRY
jgi:hypothetical protein